MLNLRGVPFGEVFCAPGAKGFFGEGYPYHRIAEKLGMTWKGTTFVSKTITVPPRAGNMPMKPDRLTPREPFIPRSIVIKPLSGHVLNAIGLTGPGAQWALEQKQWQLRLEPFMISFMSVASTAEERLRETEEFASLIKAHGDEFRAPFAIQFNRACPNSGHPPTAFYSETVQLLDVLGEIGVPVVVNFNPTVPGEVMKATAHHEACDALWIANTIPWGDDRINWEQLFGTTQSPIGARKLPVGGDGGLSGPACLPHTIERVLEARRLEIDTPIVAGNGIQRRSDVALLRKAGADAIAIGTVAMVRPWRMAAIIEEALQAA